ncbi:hypothetical protein ABL78_3013 [Leptomonas seymouri]|uniref:G domain-containing protein n=1 Tax=Leptomonas seymouri TaxID=5684 RepID=A0A0N1I045_LEPSE|nr:hypothetical protein ABL78_3013 [Leptomonas seymouri]|eukprot:KPI87903.1 hypothetical protein ABL78_3013 [Leptomonas seymouri]
MKAFHARRGAAGCPALAIPASLLHFTLLVPSRAPPRAAATHSSGMVLHRAGTVFTPGGGVFRCTRVLLQPSSRHKIVIPALSVGEGNSSRGTSNDGGQRSSPYASSSAIELEYMQHRGLSPDVVQFIPPESAAQVQRAHQVDAFRESNDALAQQLWRDSKSHLRKQQKLIDEFGVDGAVRETLQPSSTSFREQLRQRPLDRAILQEIYLGLHGRRIERKLKRGVSWEHWITKGDGTAPVFNTSHKAQQTFAFGGDIRQLRCATHPQQFPVVLSRTSSNPAASAEASSPPGNRSKLTSRSNRKHSKDARMKHRDSGSTVPRESLLPEVAVIGRTSSGKSSLINAAVNATITPYGHLQGTTDAVRFYSVANRLVLVDCPGYGHYNPIATPSIDGVNAVKAMRAYLACGASPGALQRRKAKSDALQARVAASGRDVRGDKARGAAAPHLVDAEDVGGDSALRSSSSLLHPAQSGGGGSQRAARQYQPRNLKRVLVCVSAHGMQHLDYAYCDLLESYEIPFSVVFTKTDSAPIRFLARLVDFTRSQLVRYTQCKEILLTSSLRIAGIDKVQELLGSFAAANDPWSGATMDFSAIV